MILDNQKQKDFLFELIKGTPIALPQQVAVDDVDQVQLQLAEMKKQLNNLIIAVKNAKIEKVLDFKVQKKAK